MRSFSGLLRANSSVWTRRISRRSTSLTNEDRRTLAGRFSEDEYYDLVREFLTEERAVPMAYVVDKDGQDVFVDPNAGNVISPDTSGWDQADYERFFRKQGINHIVVRDSKAIPTGEYSKQAFLRRVGAPKRGRTIKVVQGQPVGPGSQVEGQKLQDALLDNDWTEIRENKPLGRIKLRNQWTGEPSGSPVNPEWQMIKYSLDIPEDVESPWKALDRGHMTLDSFEQVMDKLYPNWRRGKR